MSEEWKPIPGHPNYEASNLGRVRSVDRSHWCGYMRRQIKGKILSPHVASDGYARVCLYTDGRMTGMLVHRAVALAFLGLPPPGLEVCHIDGDKSNCRAVNLKYGTPVQNNADKKRHGSHLHGENLKHAKLTERQVIQIRKLAREGHTQQSISDLYGVTRSNVAMIISQKTWKHVGG